MDDTVIKVENLSKKFSRHLRRSMAYGSIDLARNFFGFKTNPRLRKSEFWAIEDVSFELKKGDSLGIIGVNGSGKSTLLRLLTGIFPPDKGRIMINGSVGSLISVGAGFHPHMTGRENIYLNGTILGMTKKEIKEKFDSIVSFADIGDFLDAPVSTYSSGMYVRLGFAIAIHRQPDILLVDEILSVGDLSFRNKSLRQMAEYREKANALIFISHDIEQVRILCNRVIVMDHGKVIFDGKTHEGLVFYEELSRDIRLKNYKNEMDKLDDKLIRSRGIDDGGTVAIKELVLIDSYGNKTDSFEHKESIRISCTFKVSKKIESLSFYIGVHRDDTDYSVITLVSNENDKNKFSDINEGTYKMMCAISGHNLKPGIYNPSIAFRNDKTFETYKKLYSKITFRVKSDGKEMERGLISVNDKWELAKID